MVGAAGEGKSCAWCQPVPTNAQHWVQVSTKESKVHECWRGLSMQELTLPLRFVQLLPCNVGEMFRRPSVGMAAPRTRIVRRERQHGCSSTLGSSGALSPVLRSHSPSSLHAS